MEDLLNERIQELQQVCQSTVKSIRHEAGWIRALATQLQDLDDPGELNSSMDRWANGSVASDVNGLQQLILKLRATRETIEELSYLLGPSEESEASYE